MRAYSYKKKRKKLSSRSKARIFLCTVLVIVILFIVYYFCVVSPIVVSLSQEKVRSLSTSVISESVEDVLSTSHVSYSDLVNVEYNDKREITLISTNSIEINNLVRRITYQVQVKIDAIGNQGVEIALGTFTGIPFLYGLGPEVSVKLVPIGTVNTKFDSSFTSAGLNQTLHRLYFTVNVNVGVVLPSMTKNFLTSLEVELCESVIVGKVPEVYLQGGVI